MSKKPTQKLVRETADSIRGLLENLADVDATGEPYFNDAKAFMTQAEVMLGKQLDSMISTEPKPAQAQKTTKEAKK